MLTWHYVTRAAYDAASDATKTEDKLYFLSDTKEIMRGTQNFTESCILFTDEPAVKAVGKLYINATTLEGKIWNGSAWTTVIQPVQAAVDASDTSKPVSGKAVADYVGTEIAKVTGSGNLVADVSYNKADHNLTVSMADGSSDTILMEGLAVDLVYDKSSGLLQVKDAAGTTIGTGINLDLERFVSSASYDHSTQTISLVFNDGEDPLSIDIGDLVDTYTAKNSSTVALTVTGNEFVAEAIVASTQGNLLQKTDAGLYVAPVDLSALQLKDTDAVVGNIATFDADGNTVDGAVKAGGATLATEASASVLATEAAVAAVRSALQASIDTKMAKVGTGHADEIITADANGDAKASGVKAGGAAMSATPNAATLATEKAVDTFVNDYAVAKASIATAAGMQTTAAAASDEKVASEKAVVEAMTWKTTV